MKILIVENDGILTDRIEIAAKKMKSQGHEVRELTRLKQVDAQTILQNILWCDVMAMYSTLMYHDQNQHFAKLFSHVQAPKQIWVAGHDMTKDGIPGLSDQDYFGIMHHKLYQWNIWAYEYDQNDSDNFTLIDIITPGKRHADVLEAEKKAAADLIQLKLDLKTKTTGRKIKICELQINSMQVKELKRGMIVDEIDASSIDPNPSRGIWVYGITEPVKLLNEGRYSEYEVISDLTIETLADEICKQIGRQCDKTALTLIAGIVHYPDNNLTTWVRATEILDQLGAERRGHRPIVDKLITKYLKPVEA